jgi:hypothetical protein
MHAEADSREFVSTINYTTNISSQTLHETERSHITSGSQTSAAIVIHIRGIPNSAITLGSCIITTMAYFKGS